MASDKEREKDGIEAPYARLRDQFFEALKHWKSADEMQWTIPASDMTTLLLAVDDYRIRRKQVEEAESELFAVYEAGRQRGLDSARWLACELSKARILLVQDKCCGCEDYGYEACACCWVEASIEAVKGRKSHEGHD